MTLQSLQILDFERAQRNRSSRGEVRRLWYQGTVANHFPGIAQRPLRDVDDDLTSAFFFVAGLLVRSPIEFRRSESTLGCCNLLVKCFDLE